MGWLIIGCFLAILIYGAMMWYANTDVVSVKKGLISLAFIGLLLAAGLLIINVARGNVGFLPLLIILFPIVKKLRAQNKSQSFHQRSSTGSSMTRAEAFDILGLKEGASDQEIKAAYRKLIASAHPDTGGTDWMAAKLNEAKRLLLKE